MTSSCSAAQVRLGTLTTHVHATALWNAAHQTTGCSTHSAKNKDATPIMSAVMIRGGQKKRENTSTHGTQTRTALAGRSTNAAQVTTRLTTSTAEQPIIHNRRLDAPLNLCIHLLLSSASP